MNKMSLDAMAREQLVHARSSTSGRSASTVHGGHETVLRHTLIAMVAGTTLAEHRNPGEATVLVLTGRVTLGAGEVSWDGRAGDLLVVPPHHHDLTAVEDAAVLLTVAVPRPLRTAGPLPEA